MNLNLDEFKKLSAQVIELGDKVNATEDVKYPAKRDFRKACQALKVEVQDLRVKANGLGKKTAPKTK